MNLKFLSFSGSLEFFELGIQYCWYFQILFFVLLTEIVIWLSARVIKVICFGAKCGDVAIFLHCAGDFQKNKVVNLYQLKLENKIVSESQAAKLIISWKLKSALPFDEKKIKIQKIWELYEDFQLKSGRGSTWLLKTSMEIDFNRNVNVKN